VGFGDIVLDERWRLLAATESMNGFLLIGWSTAYLISVITVIQDIDRQIDALRQRILDRNQNS
ncbi:MAG: two pore domain potassium channel family protein, partial [Pseudomonadota bacterium]